MTLPPIESNILPEAERRWSPESRRIAEFLRQIDAHLGTSITIRVFGAAAVALYTAEDDESDHVTVDIDVGKPRPLVDTLERA